MRLRNISRDTVENSVQRGIQYIIEDEDGSLAYFVLKDFYLFIDEKDETITPCLIKDGFWEPWNTVWFGANIKEGMTVVDIGANVGYFTMTAARLAGDSGEIIAIEPNPIPMSLLRRSAVLNRLENIRFYECAVSDTNGEMQLNIPDINIGGATLQTVEQLLATSDEIGSVDTVDVRVHTLDDLLVDTVDKIDIIKMDVEGFEPHVWRGMSDVLEKHKPAVMFEYSPDRIPEDERREFIESVQQYGTIYIVTDIGTEVKVSSDYINRIDWIATLVVRPVDYGE